MLTAIHVTMFKQALKQYNSTTEDRKKHFEELKTKDMKSAHEIETQMRKLQKIHVGARFWYLVYFRCCFGHYLNI